MHLIDQIQNVRNQEIENMHYEYSKMLKNDKIKMENKIVERQEVHKRVESDSQKILLNILVHIQNIKKLKKN